MEQEPFGRNHEEGCSRSNMEEESWRRKHGGVIMEEKTFRKPGGGNMEEELWRRNRVGGIMEEESCRRNHVEEQSWRWSC